MRPRTDPVPAPHSTLVRRRRPDPVQAVRPSVHVSAQHGSRLSGRALQTCLQHRRSLASAGRGQLAVPRVRLSTYGGRAFSYVGPSAWIALPDFLKNDTLPLSTSRCQLKHFYFSLYEHTELVLGYFTVTRYTNYLLTYSQFWHEILMQILYGLF